MARALRDSKLDSREARSRLRVRGQPYWRLLESGLHLGYRRLAGRPGSWCTRRYAGHQRYVVAALGTADDNSDADGKHVLSFAQAQREALKQHRPKPGELTVKKVIEDYLEDRGGNPDILTRAEAHIFPSLGDVKVASLTTAQIRTWHKALAKAPPRVRSAADGPQQYKRLNPSDEEARRRRQSTANRILTVLKAALNHAFREGHVEHDKEWRRVKPFEDVDAARVRYLTVEEAKRLINAAQGEFRRLVQGALATGMRYGELTRLTVEDFKRDAGTVQVLRSKSGKPRHVVLTDEGVQLFSQWCAGCASTDLIFKTDRGLPWGRSWQDAPMREACKHAKIEPPVSFHILRHTWASLAVMAGTSVMVVATNLGHANTRMVERHYGHLSPSHVRDAIRRGAPKFGFAPDAKVTPLR
jgi:integrase